MTGDIGHYMEQRGDGWAMKYGPLMLAPMCNTFRSQEVSSVGVPPGYIPQSVDGKGLKIVEPAKKDANGFWILRKGPSELPEWTRYDDGRLSKTGTNFRAPAWVDVVDGNGKKRTLYFDPICYQTSCLILSNLPITFGRVYDLP